jgi:beta-phosphoglucomutase
MKKGLIFDLDGVITDTAKFHFVAWKNMADSLGISIDEKFNEKLKGISRMDSLNKILAKEGKENDFTQEQKDELAAVKNEEYVKLLEGLTNKDVLPGVNDLINQAKEKGMKLAIASASKNAPYILTKLGLIQDFDFIVDPDSLAKSKPDPEIFIKAAQGIGLDVSECIGIEDAQAGVEAIRSANMFALGVTFDGPLTNTNLTVDNLSQVNFEELINN